MTHADATHTRESALSERVEKLERWLAEASEVVQLIPKAAIALGLSDLHPPCTVTLEEARKMLELLGTAAEKWIACEEQDEMDPGYVEASVSIRRRRVLALHRGTPTPS